MRPDAWPLAPRPSFPWGCAAKGPETGSSGRRGRFSWRSRSPQRPDREPVLLRRVERAFAPARALVGRWAFHTASARNESTPLLPAERKRPLPFDPRCALAAPRPWGFTYG